VIKLVSILFAVLALNVSAWASYVDMTNTVAPMVQQAGVTNRFYGVADAKIVGTNSNWTLELYGELRSAYFSPAAIMTAGNYTNIVIDGKGVGLIRATNNGTGLAFTNSSRGVATRDASGFTVPQFLIVSNLTISNMYIRTPGCGEYSPQDLTTATTQGILVNGSHILITNCFISGAEGGIGIASWQGGVTNRDIQILNNIIERNCISISLGGSGANSNSTLYDLTIQGNRMNHWSEWSAVAPGNGDLHLDGVYLFATAGAGLDSGTMIISNVVVSHNWFGPDVLSGTNANNTTSTIFMTWYSTNTSLQVAFNFKVFNNVFSWTNKPNATDTQSPWSNGFISCNAWGNSIIANNTVVSTAATHPDTYFYGQGRAMQAADTGVKIYNNFSLDCNNGFVYDYNSGKTNFNAGFAANYNCWAGLFTFYIGSGNDFAIPPAVANSGYGFIDWATWHTATFYGVGKFDQNGTTNRPQINALTFAPLTNDTVLLNAGTNLTAWGITNDYAGNARPATGPWTIGAFQVGTNSYTPAATGGTNILTFANPITLTIKN